MIRLSEDDGNGGIVCLDYSSGLPMFQSVGNSAHINVKG